MPVGAGCGLKSPRFGERSKRNGRREKAMQMQSRREHKAVSVCYGRVQVEELAANPSIEKGWTLDGQVATVGSMVWIMENKKNKKKKQGRCSQRGQDRDRPG